MEGGAGRLARGARKRGDRRRLRGSKRWTRGHGGRLGARRGAVPIRRGGQSQPARLGRPGPCPTPSLRAGPLDRRRARRLEPPPAAFIRGRGGTRRSRHGQPDVDRPPAAGNRPPVRTGRPPLDLPEAGGRRIRSRRLDGLRMGFLLQRPRARHRGGAPGLGHPLRRTRVALPERERPQLEESARRHARPLPASRRVFRGAEAASHMP